MPASSRMRLRNAKSVLNAVLEARKRGRVELQHRLDPPLGEDDPGDLREGEVLKDAVVTPPRRAPEHGHDAQVVRREPRALRLHLLHVRAHPRPGAERGGAAEAKRRALPDEDLEIEIIVRRDGDDADLEEPRDGMLHREAAHREGGFFRGERELEILNHDRERYGSRTALPSSIRWKRGKPKRGVWVD
jgi:hypothetical protein